MKKLFTFFALTLFTATAFAQVPNQGFETWQTKVGVGFTGPYTYDMPQDWQLGFISELMAAFGMKPNVGKSTVAQSGNFALRLNANADSIGSDIMTSFALPANSRPGALAGSFRTSGPVTNPNDYGHAFIFMTKWNGTSRDTIGFGGADLDSSPTTFRSFSAPITYNGTVNPDSAIVYFLYFPEAANTHIMIDNLSLQSVLGTPKESAAIAQINLFPNPVADNATLTFNASSAAKSTLLIRDLTGREIKNQPLGLLPAGNNSIPVNTSDLKPGLYLATLQTASGSQTLRFVKR